MAEIKSFQFALFLLQDGVKSVNAGRRIVACKHGSSVRDACKVCKLKTRSKLVCSDLRSMESLHADASEEVTR
jgi:hypothetical protein